MLLVYAAGKSQQDAAAVKQGRQAAGEGTAAPDSPLAGRKEAVRRADQCIHPQTLPDQVYSTDAHVCL